MKTLALVMTIFLSLSYCLASASHAETTFYKCPPEISVRWSVDSVPSGWETSAAAENLVRHFLSAVTFSHGHPRERAFLRPANREELGDGKTREFYQLSYPDSPQGWLICMYLNTPATVFKPLVKRHQSCEVTYASQTISAIECR